MFEVKKKINSKKLEKARKKILSNLANIPVNFEIKDDKLMGYIDVNKIKFPKYEEVLEIKLDGILGNIDDDTINKLNLPTDVEYHLTGDIISLVKINSCGRIKLFIENSTLMREMNLINVSYVVFKNNNYLYPYPCHYLFSKDFITTRNVETIIFQNEKFINNGERFQGNFGMNIKAQNVCLYDSEIKSTDYRGINISCSNINIINTAIESKRVEIVCDKYTKHYSYIKAPIVYINEKNKIIYNLRNSSYMYEQDQTREKLLTLPLNKASNE